MRYLLDLIVVSAFAATLVRPQSIQDPSRPAGPAPIACPIDLVLLLDRSGSICDTDPSFLGYPKRDMCNNWQLMLDFAVNFTAGIEIGSGGTGAQVALITFENTAIVQWNLTRHTSQIDLHNAIRSMKYVPHQHTHMADAFDMTRSDIFNTAGDRPWAENVVIVITDGWPYDDQQLRTVLDSAKALQSSNVRVFSLGVVTRDLNMTILQQISSPPHQLEHDYFKINDFNSLGTIRSTLSTLACPLTTTTTTTPATTTTHKASACMIDLLFLVDLSGSICDVDPSFNKQEKTCLNFRKEIEFIVKFLDEIGDIGKGGTLVALITFDTKARINWHLNKYSDKRSLLAAVGEIRYEPMQHTHTADALDMIKDVFVPSYDRQDAENVVIVITDGYPFDANQKAILTHSISEMHKLNIKVYAIGATGTNNEETLKQISSYPHTENSNYFITNDFGSLNTILEPLTREACHDTAVKCPVDLALLLDRSGSICNNENVNDCEDWREAKSFLAALVDGMRIGESSTSQASVALITFDSRAHLHWTLNRYQNRADLKNAIAAIEYISWQQTFTAAALEMMMLEVFGQPGDRPDAHNVAVILSDGLPTAGEQRDRTIPLAVAAHAAGVKIYAVGVTKKINIELLKSISSAPHIENQNYFRSPDFQHASTLVNQVRTSTCKPTEITAPVYCPLELVFLVDVSAAICEDKDVHSCSNWNYVKDFIRNVVSGLKIGERDTRVAMITFGDSARILWMLDRYTNKGDLLDAIEGMSYSPKQVASTADAIHLARTNVLHPSNVRPNTHKVALLVTGKTPTVGKQREKSIPEAMLSAIDGISVLPVGVLAGIEEYFVRMMCAGVGNAGSDYFTADQYSELDRLVPQVLASSAMTRADCDNWLLT